MIGVWVPNPWTGDGPCLLCAEEHPKIVHIRMHASLDEADDGRHWCDRCALPSVLVVPVRATCCHGWPLAIGVPPIAFCTNHQEPVPLPHDQ